jgi:hypothetical protein
MLPGTLEGEDVSIDAQGSLSRSAKVVVSISKTYRPIWQYDLANSFSSPS